MSLHLTGISTDSKFSHFAWSNQPRKQGGLGPELKLPLVADRSMRISRDYGVLLEDEGIALRGLFLIDPKGILRWGCLLTINHQSAKLIAVMSLRQITVNDLPVGRSVDETIRLIKAFQFTVCFFWLIFFSYLIHRAFLRIKMARFALQTGWKAPKPSKPTRKPPWSTSPQLAVPKLMGTSTTPRRNVPAWIRLHNARLLRIASYHTN